MRSTGFETKRDTTTGPDPGCATPAFPASALHSLRLVVTHPGTAHRDDLYACALLLAHSPNAELERRHPTAQDLAAPDVAVVDVGGSYDPTSANFDHHQLITTPPDRPCCALTLVLAALGREPLARLIWPWLEFLEWQDVYGPVATAKRFTPQVPWADGFARTASPADQWLLRCCEAGDAATLRAIGRHLIAELDSAQESFAHLDAAAHWHTVRGLAVLDWRKAGFPKEFPGNIQNAWLRARGHPPAIIVGASRREPGCVKLVRFLDHPAVDFGRLRGQSEVRFIHANGFLACACVLSEKRLFALLAASIAPGQTRKSTHKSACQVILPSTNLRPADCETP